MSLLFYMDAGPCIGHPCDMCFLCQRGHCCRKDMPDYLPPSPGAWQGVIYGQIGVLNEENGKVECHCCGKVFKSLHSHIFRSHGLWSDEYRILFGLNATCNLLTSSTANILRGYLVRSRLQGKMLGNGHLPTPEQMSAIRKGRKARPQARLKYLEAAGKRVPYGSKISAAKTANSPILICSQCGDQFKRTFKRKKYCSPECGRKGATDALRHPWLESACRECGKLFKWQPHPSAQARVYCSLGCSRAVRS